jgi:DNA-binding LytR/AlgR family response regulator
MTIRLLVVTAKTNFYVALQRYIPTIELINGHEVVLVGAAFGMAEARQEIAIHQPDVVLSDLGSPDSPIDGLAVARWARQMKSPPAVVLCSLYEDCVFQTASQDAGSVGFINKSHIDSQLPALLGQLFP